jgi:SAM-dependent methyltransferase
VKDPSDIYTAEWFAHDFDGLQPEFDIVAGAIEALFRPLTAVDVGCGPGMVVKALRELGVEAVGIEGSDHGIAYAEEHVGVGEHIRKADLRLLVAELVEGSPFDLVVCTEVAEHLEAKHADHLVDLLCELAKPGRRESFVASIARGWVVFTAAPPGQGGHDHVNEQPLGYWVEKFSARGFEVHIEATRLLMPALEPLRRLGHMRRNMLVLRRPEVS